MILGAAALLGAAAAWRAAAARRRASALWRGELHELSELWTWVDDARWHARFSAERREAERLPVVFVHGFGISGAYFMPAAERLATRFDVYAPDLPGHGDSDASTRRLGIAVLAAALRRWLGVVGIERASLIANSMGCQIATELALRDPDLVDRLVLVGPTLDPDARSVRRLLPRFVAGGLHEPPGLGLLLARDYLRAGPHLLAELEAMLAYRLEHTLPRVRVPVLLVRGEHDRVASARWLDELARLTPGARAVVVPKGGHAAHYGRADEFVRLIGPFLESGRPASLDPLVSHGG